MGQLQEIATGLVIPGLPEWTGLVALLLLLLVALAYLLMPFAVFGVKGRLEVIEAQLDELQAEIRALSLRLADAAPRRMAMEEWEDAPPALGRRAAAGQDGGAAVPPRSRPPVPPPAAWPEGGRGARAEPRLDWPGQGGGRGG